MLRRSLGIAFATAFALVSCPAWAEPPARALALAEALELAAPSGSLSGGLPVRTAVAQLDVARTEVGVAGILPNPRVSLGTTTATAILTGAVVVFLPIFGQVGLAKDAARAQVATREANVSSARNDAVLAAAIAWTDLWLAEREGSIAEDEASRSAKVADVARGREEEGSAPHLDVLRAEADAARARAEADALVLAVRAADARLSVALGIDAATTRWATTGVPLAETELPPASDDPRASLDHPNVRAANAALVEADALASRAARARFPVVALQAGGNFFKRQAPENDVQFAVTFDLPLFDGPIATRADSQRALASVALSVAKLDASARVTAARAEALSTIARARATTEKVLPAAQAAAALTLEAYESGALDLSSVLAAEQTLAQARISAVRAEAERGRAIARLRHAVGLR